MRRVRIVAPSRTSAELTGCGAGGASGGGRRLILLPVPWWVSRTQSDIV